MSTAAPLAVATPAKPSDPAELRRQRGQAIAAVCRIENRDGLWVVPSQSGAGRYYVDAIRPHCSCKDFEARSQPCKHVFAVRYVIERESHPDGTETVTETLTVSRQTTAPRPTYKQDWPAYNAAQIAEKAKFQSLLADLCRGVPEPAANPKGGRPPLSMADRVFACASRSTRPSRAGGHRPTCRTPATRGIWPMRPTTAGFLATSKTRR